MVKVILALSLAVVPASGAQERSAVDEAENVILELESSVLSPWKKAWTAGKLPEFADVFLSPAAAQPWEGRRKIRREKSGISEFAWSSPPASAKDRAAVLSEASDYLAAFSVVDSVEFQVLETGGENPAAPTARVRFDLRGRLADGTRRTDRGILELTLARAPAGLKIARLESSSMETLTARAASFEDATLSAGLQAVAAHPRREAIRRGGYALAVGDYDGDGYPDLYVGSMGAGQLFRNRGDGTYEEATVAAGLGQDTLVKSALFADVDNDGRTDLVVQRFVSAPAEELTMYRNAGNGRFSPAKAKIKRANRHPRAMSMAAADFNGDGKTDLYVGYPGTYDFTDGRLDVDRESSSQALYLNKGDWRFEEMAEASEPKAFTELVRPHSALATDIDRDGRMDLLVVDDRGFASRLYLNKGSEKFISAADRAGLRNQSWGMMAVAGDYDGDGFEDIYFTNIDLNAGRRYLRLLEKTGAVLEGGDLQRLNQLSRVLQGNTLYRSMGDGSFVDVTQKAGVGWAGEASAGAEWLDYDNDGLLDLYVTNGLWSADPKKDFAQTYIREQMSAEAGVPKKGEAPNTVMRRLQKNGMSFAGYQRNRLFRNDGDGGFTEVGYVTGADRIEDGYMVAYADFDRDGDLDLVLRNADAPDLKRGFPAVTLLRNLQAQENRSLVVYPRGRVTVGARVTISAGGKRQTREIRAVQGAVQNEAVAHFGIGRSESVELLEVRWPSGAVERFENIKPGRLVIREGLPELEYLTLNTTR